MLSQTIKAVRHDEFDPEHLKYSTSIYKEELLIKHLTGIFNAKLDTVNISSADLNLPSLFPFSKAITKDLSVHLSIPNNRNNY